MRADAEVALDADPTSHTRTARAEGSNISTITGRGRQLGKRTLYTAGGSAFRRDFVRFFYCSSGPYFNDGPLTMAPAITPPNQQTELVVCKDVKARLSRIVGTLGPIATNPDPTFSDPRQVALELTLTIDELIAAWGKVRELYWPRS